jgi:hypothetical protein
VDSKVFRFDLGIALAALLISAVAALASAYQTYVIRKQFSATVWPYLTFVSYSQTDKFFELDISNAGIGPALILTSKVTRHGKLIAPVPSPTTLPAIAIALEADRVEAKADAAKAAVKNDLRLAASTILAGDVIPAGGKVRILRVDGEFITRHVYGDINNIDVKLCYCSLLGDCWTQSLWATTVQPQSVRGCSHA